jgi:hypothetical protein
VPESFAEPVLTIWQLIVSYSCFYCSLWHTISLIGSKVLAGSKLNFLRSLARVKGNITISIWQALPSTGDFCTVLPTQRQFVIIHVIRQVRISHYWTAALHTHFLSKCCPPQKFRVLICSWKHNMLKCRSNKDRSSSSVSYKTVRRWVTTNYCYVRGNTVLVLGKLHLWNFNCFFFSWLTSVLVGTAWDSRLKCVCTSTVSVVDKICT